MQKIGILLAVVCLAVTAVSFTAQATPELADRTGFSCGHCHSGGRHHGN